MHNIILNFTVYLTQYFHSSWQETTVKVLYNVDFSHKACK